MQHWHYPFLLKGALLTTMNVTFRISSDVLEILPAQAEKARRTPAECVNWALVWLDVLTDIPGFEALAWKPGIGRVQVLNLEPQSGEETTYHTNLTSRSHETLRKCRGKLGYHDNDVIETALRLLPYVVGQARSRGKLGVRLADGRFVLPSEVR
jgi:hypothetical protein